MGVIWVKNDCVTTLFSLSGERESQTQTETEKGKDFQEALYLTKNGAINFSNREASLVWMRSCLKQLYSSPSTDVVFVLAYDGQGIPTAQPLLSLRHRDFQPTVDSAGVVLVWRRKPSVSSSTRRSNGLA